MSTRHKAQGKKNGNSTMSGWELTRQLAQMSSCINIKYMFWTNLNQIGPAAFAINIIIQIGNFVKPLCGLWAPQNWYFHRFFLLTLYILYTVHKGETLKLNLTCGRFSSHCWVFDLKKEKLNSFWYSINSTCNLVLIYS